MRRRSIFFRVPVFAASVLALAMFLFVTAAVPAPGDHLVVTGPGGAQTAGNAFTLTVEAQDNSNATITGYTGTITFTSSDPQAVLPADYTFTGSGGSNDNGVHTFSNAVTLKTAGPQTITATDTGDGTILGSANVTVDPASLDHFTSPT